MTHDLAKAGQATLESLAAAAQDGDRNSLEALALQVREPLRAFLSTRVPQDVDADDLAQETLLRAFRHLDSYDPSRPFTTWLFTIGKRLAINHVVAEKRRNSQPLQTEPEAATALRVHATGEIWRRAKEVLSEEAYRALWLRYARDASIKDVAADLGRTQVSTKVLLYRSRKRLLLEPTS